MLSRTECNERICFRNDSISTDPSLNSSTRSRKLSLSLDSASLSVHASFNLIKSLNII